MSRAMVVVLLVAVLSSCTSVYNLKMSNKNGELSSAPPTSPDPVTAGDTKTRYTFWHVGQSVTLQNNESVELSLAGLDPDRVTFDIATNLETKQVTLTLVDREQKVVLTSKCQTVIRAGIKQLPPIEIAGELPPEQVVITPLYDGNCMQIGYEFRYGAEERGCRVQALQTLQRFYDCNKRSATTPRRPEASPPDDSPCAYLRKLGLPCD